MSSAVISELQRPESEVVLSIKVFPLPVLPLPVDLATAVASSLSNCGKSSAICCSSLFAKLLKLMLWKPESNFDESVLAPRSSLLSMFLLVRLLVGEGVLIVDFVCGSDILVEL